MGMWLGNVGLGKHAHSFIEKNVKGYALFDLDSTKLKVGYNALSHSFHILQTPLLSFFPSFMYMSASI